MRSIVFLMLSTALVLVGFGCQRATESKANSAQIDRDQILFDARKSGLIMDEKEVKQMADPLRLQKIDGANPSDVSSYLKTDAKEWKSAALADVTGGGSFGLAFSNREKEQTTVIAKMGNLPTLDGEKFYQGWLVKRGPDMKVVNLGQATPVEDRLVIVFITQTDVSDYDFFVLTQEQSTHILEGSFR